MKTLATRFLPSLDRLEDRWVPAGNVSTSLSFGTLTVTGDLFANHIVIDQPGFNQIRITSGANVTTINGGAGPVTINAVTNLVFKLGLGDDSIQFDQTNNILLAGSLTINYGTTGSGNKRTETINASAATSLTVAKNVSIAYAAGDDNTAFEGLNVGGNMSVTHTAGDSELSISSGGGGAVSTISGSLSVSNNNGFDEIAVSDTNIGGSVTIVNTGARVSDNQAGEFTFKTGDNTPAGQLVSVGGNVSVRFTTGDVDGVELEDAIFKGSIAVNTGSGFADDVDIGPDERNLTTQVKGNVSIAGTGAMIIRLGGEPSNATALRVQIGGFLSITTGAGTDTVTFEDLAVGKTTTVSTGSGDDSVTIDNGNSFTGSIFNGAFSLNTGNGNDTVNIGIGGGEGGPVTTTFNSTVNVNLGAHNDTLNLATNGNVALFGASRFDGGADFDTLSDIGGAIMAGRLTFVSVPNFVSFP
jgi:hypothetical protein